ncbi:hypothetical protein AR505_0334 [methanogenic archaeon ISO4-H5]|nr:hypothetical protein AR505_0334 [methanogenic archaeon ISO4-H5]
MVKVKIPIVSQEDLDFFIASIPKNVDHYLNNDKGWAVSFLEDNGRKVRGYMEVEAVDLIYTSRNEQNENDANNAIALHKALSGKFDNAEMSAGAFWTFYALHHLEYLNRRSGLAKYKDKSAVEGEEDINSTSKAVNRIRTKYCVKWDPSMKELGDCLLPILYRVADLTYDPGREDPYELTRLAFKNSDIKLRITQTLAFFSKSVVVGILTYVYERNKAGYSVGSAEAQAICAHINAVSGNLRIDTMTSDEVYDLIVKFKEWYDKQK